jgi:peptidoglycan/xylan/chitin deacetylase (PgdA/CDA1 family)
MTVLYAILHLAEIILCGILYYTGFVFIFTKTACRGGVRIIYYHEIGDSELLGGAALDPGTFAKQMKYVSRMFACISIDDLHRYLDGTRDLPPRALVVTFDAGYRGNLIIAYPLLKKRNIPFTIYLTTDYIEKGRLPWAFSLKFIIEHAGAHRFRLPSDPANRTFDLKTQRGRLSCYSECRNILQRLVPAERNAIINGLALEYGVDIDSISHGVFMTWEEVSLMARDDLVSFGSHTVTHADLSRLGPDDARLEIESSRSIIEEKAGCEASSFCYPRGDYTKEVKDAVMKAGYRSAVTVIHGKNTRDSDRLELRRIAARDVPICVFAADLAGMWRSGALEGRLTGFRRNLKKAGRRAHDE